MSEQTYNVLFLCTGNSCRSILAECILNRIGEGRFKAYSAGSHPSGEPHPVALELLQRFEHPIEHLRSKSWEEFAVADAPAMDFVVTVCDQAAGEVCPIWPGKPLSAHWGFPDPAKFEGDEVQTRQFFEHVYGDINQLLTRFVGLSLDSMNPQDIARHLRELEATAPEQLTR